MCWTVRVVGTVVNTSLVVIALAIITLIGWLEYLRTCREVYRKNGSADALEAMGKAASGFWKYCWNWLPGRRNR